MNIGKFFMRKKSKDGRRLSINDRRMQELKEETTERITNVELKQFIERLGLEIPAILKSWNEQEQEYDCVSNTGENVRIFLDSEHCLYFECTESNSSEQTVRKYMISENNKIFFTKGEIRKNNKRISYINHFYCCEYILTKENECQLEICVGEPSFWMGKEPRLIFQHQEEIQQYLLNLENLSDTMKIYEQVMRILNFSEADIQQASWIKIRYYQIKKEAKLLRSAIILSRGKMQEYAIFENGKTFHVSKTGNWKYISDEMEISYQEKENKYTLQTSWNDEQNIIVIKPDDINRIKRRIFQLWWVFNQ